MVGSNLQFQCWCRLRPRFQNSALNVIQSRHSKPGHSNVRPGPGCPCALASAVFPPGCPDPQGSGRRFRRGLHRDGPPDKVMGECADSAISRKFAASVGKGAANATTTWVNGYLDSCTS